MDFWGFELMFPGGFTSHREKRLKLVWFSGVQDGPSTMPW